MRRGWTYARTRPAYGIYFLNYLEFPEARADKFVHRLSVRDEAEGFVLSDKMQWIFIELPKFDALRAKGGLTPDETTLEWWCRMLVNPADKELERIAMRDPIMKQAREKLAHLSSDPATRELLRMREKADVDWNSMLQESHESGLAKGRQEGEAKASLQILVNLLKTSSFAALSDEEIADLTSSDLALVRQARRNSQG